MSDKRDKELAKLDKARNAAWAECDKTQAKFKALQTKYRAELAAVTLTDATLAAASLDAITAAYAADAASKAATAARAVRKQAQLKHTKRE